MRSRWTVSLLVGLLFVAGRAGAAGGPRVRVSVRGTDGALHERRIADGDDAWAFVCELPCETTVTPDPFAEHRVIGPDANVLPVEIRGADGEHVELDVKFGSSSARRILFVGGGITAGAGLILFTATIAGAIVPAPSERDCPSCESREEADRARTTAGIGVVAMGAGGLMFLMGALLGRSSIAITPGREQAPRGHPTLRQPEWVGPEPPKPPPIHARFLRITF